MVDVNDKSLKTPLLTSSEAKVAETSPQISPVKSAPNPKDAIVPSPTNKQNNQADCSSSGDISKATLPKEIEEDTKLDDSPSRKIINASPPRKIKDAIVPSPTNKQNNQAAGASFSKNQDDAILDGSSSGENSKATLPKETKEDTKLDDSPSNKITNASPPRKIKDMGIYIYILVTFAVSFSLYWLLLVLGQFSREQKTHGFVDALYIFTVTFSTVGYGDISPSTVPAKIISICLVVNGIFCLEAVVTCVGELQQRAITALPGGNKKIVKLLYALFCLIICLLVGVMVLRFHEGLGWMDSIYLTFISVSTVGYGDFSFKSLGGRFFAAFWILSSTISMACLLIRCGEMKTKMTTEQEPQLDAVIVQSENDTEKKVIMQDIEDNLKKLNVQDMKIQEILNKIHMSQE